MKHSLQLRLSQHLTLTPQLQQSIRLLQLSTLELNQEIEKFLQDNPLLEREDGMREEAGAAPQDGSIDYASSSVASGSTDAATGDGENSDPSHFEEDYGHGGTPRDDNDE